MFPYDVIFGVLMKLEVMNEHPKSKKFTDVVASDDGVSTDLQHPSILILHILLLKRVEHLPILERHVPSCYFLLQEHVTVLRYSARLATITTTVTPRDCCTRCLLVIRVVALSFACMSCISYHVIMCIAFAYMFVSCIPAFSPLSVL